MSKAICERIGAKVRQRRDELRLSLDELAALTELSKTGLWQVEKGRSEPSAGTVVRLCRALRVSADWLLDVGEEG